MSELADLSRVAATLSHSLTTAGVRHAISGALAMAANGYVRATQDLDILVIAPALQLPAVFQMVRDCGFEGDDAELIESVRNRYMAVLRGGPMSVDVLVPVLPYHHTIPDRAIARSLHGHDVPFVSPEDLIVLKMLWRRTKDVPDMHALIAATPRLDESYVTETLAGIIPGDDPRHAELQGWLNEFRFAQ